MISEPECRTGGVAPEVNPKERTVGKVTFSEIID
jgi:hypothetical protein